VIRRRAIRDAGEIVEAQLAEAGYAPADIRYVALLALSLRPHRQRQYVYGATWLVRQVERDAMFSDAAPQRQRATFDALKNSKTVIIKVTTTTCSAMAPW
jgi:hypothetical protein